MKEAKTNKAKWYRDEEGSWVCFKVAQEDAAAMAQTVDSTHEYVVSVKLYHNKRSNDANRYFWALVDKLSGVTGIPPMDIYRSYIPDVGDNSTIVQVREDRLKAWERVWCEGHHGRMVEDMGRCADIEGYHNVKSYISSSDYDTVQMSRLIDLIIQDCKEVGIDTLTPDEKAKMMAAWESRYA